MRKYPMTSDISKPWPEDPVKNSGELDIPMTHRTGIPKQNLSSLKKLDRPPRKSAMIMTRDLESAEDRERREKDEAVRAKAAARKKAK